VHSPSPPLEAAESSVCGLVDSANEFAVTVLKASPPVVTEPSGSLSYKLPILKVFATESPTKLVALTWTLQPVPVPRGSVAVTEKVAARSCTVVKL